MEASEYKVGIHAFKVFLQGGEPNSLLPSFEPFLYQIKPDEHILFELTQDFSFRPQAIGSSIGEFDCGGADFDVYCMSDGGYQFFISQPGGKFLCFLQTNKMFSQGIFNVKSDSVEDQSFFINNCLMLMYAFASAPHKTLLMHASVIKNSGKGFLFLGISGTGKSTHSALWLKHVEGSELMNDDNPVICIPSDGIPRVYGSPWSGKTPCYKNMEAPIGAFVHIHQSPNNHIKRETVLQAFSSLLISCSVMKWDSRIYDAECDTLSLLVEKSPVYLLDCRPDEEAAMCSSQLLLS